MLRSIGEFSQRVTEIAVLPKGSVEAAAEPGAQAVKQSDGLFKIH